MPVIEPGFSSDDTNTTFWKDANDAGLLIKSNLTGEALKQWILKNNTSFLDWTNDQTGEFWFHGLENLK